MRAKPPMRPMHANNIKRRRRDKVHEGVGVCITTLNEAATIGPLVRGLKDRGFQVFVVDGGSTDDTVNLAANECAQVHCVSDGYELWQRRPIGPCVQAGWHVALKAGCTRIVQMDAGGSHQIEDLPRLLNTRADVVIGSRFIEGAHYEGRFWRAILSEAAAVACNLAQSGPWVRDWTSGYRVYSERAIRELLAHNYVAQGHSFNLEVLARARFAKLSIAEVPITYRAGRSSFSWRSVNEAFFTWLHLLHNIGSPH